ncbi:MAG: hypothetical protein LUD38_16055, partial [Parabacteroides sp.]|nr:hypothetical protein [Parabacteroides sp.]
IGADGIITPVAQEIIGSMASYTELSPSGSGVRIFVKGLWVHPWNKNKALGLEVYKSGRFLTVTGRII